MISITSSRKRRGEQLKQILKKYPNITYIDSHEILSNAGYVEDPGKNADGIHLTDKGAELIVNAILGKILPRTPRISFLEVTRAIKISLNAKQKIMAGMIEGYFLAEGYSNNLIAAAIAAAFQESGLNPMAMGDCKDGKPKSCDNCSAMGLFQLSDYGAGAGMSCIARWNPVINIKTILEKEKSTIMGVEKKAKDPKATIEDLAYMFGKAVEKSKAWTWPLYRKKAAMLFGPNKRF